MKIAAIGCLMALLIYTVGLILVELSTSQDYVRHYFTDIEGEVPFHGINTTLSAFLLAGAALLLIFAALAPANPESRRASLFLMGQAGLFALLAFDDRFQLHEAIAYRIEVGDHFVMAVWAAVQIAILLVLCRPRFIPLRSAIQFAVGGAFFAVMMIFDVAVPQDAVLRLSIEDLAKTWATAFFLAAAWNLARFHLGLASNMRTLAQFTFSLANNPLGSRTPSSLRHS